MPTSLELELNLGLKLYHLVRSGDKETQENNQMLSPCPRVFFSVPLYLFFDNLVRPAGIEPA